MDDDELNDSVLQFSIAACHFCNCPIHVVLPRARPRLFLAWPVAWPAVGQVGQAKTGQAGYMMGLALASLWPE